MVDAGDREVVDAECQRAFRIEAERERERGADRAPVGHGNDVAACVLRRPAGDGGGDPLDHVDEALALRRGHMGRRNPVLVGEAARLGRDLVPGEPLPRAEILLVQVRASMARSGTAWPASAIASAV